MTVQLNVVSAIVFGAIAMNISATFLESDVRIGAVGLACGFTVFLLHWYSPLPSTNGGMGTGPPKWQTWGFRYEIDEERTYGGESE